MPDSGCEGCKAFVTLSSNFRSDKWISHGWAIGHTRLALIDGHCVEEENGDSTTLCVPDPDEAQKCNSQHLFFAAVNPLVFDPYGSGVTIAITTTVGGRAARYYSPGAPGPYYEPIVLQVTDCNRTDQIDIEISAQTPNAQVVSAVAHYGCTECEFATSP
jgi:hypothetical protein